MKDSGMGQSNSAPFVIRSNDIVFECPKCGKNLVVDQDAEGLTVLCPQCGTEVIVPPRPSVAPAPPSTYRAPPKAPPPPPPPAQKEVQPQVTQLQAQHVDTAALHTRLAALSAQLKELQRQRAGLISRMMVHVEEVNRILEQLGGMQGAENEVHREWSRIREETTNAKRAGDVK